MSLGTTNDASVLYASEAGTRDPGAGVTTALLHLVKRGDREARGRLYERLQPALIGRIRRHPLYREVMTYTGEDDIVAGAILRCEEEEALAGGLDGRSGSVRRFLNRIVDGEVLDVFRRGMAAKRGGGWRRLRADNMLEGDEVAVELLSAEPTPTSEVRYRETCDRFRAALNDREWQLLEAVSIQGMSSEEVAAVHGTTAAAIRGVLLRARAKVITAEALAQAREAARRGS